MADRPWLDAPLGREAFEKLAAEVPGTALQSVLLEVMHRRAAARSPAEVLAQYGKDGYCAPSPVDQRTAVAVDAALLEAAAGFEAIELSPVAPLGACSTFAATDQNRVLSALRSTEIVSDPTNVLALECAARMRRDPRAETHLATSQRVLRAQPLPNVKGYSRHFRIFVLASGGIEAVDHGFTVDTLVRHVRTVLAALDRLAAPPLDYALGARRVDVLATPARAALGDRVAAALGPIASRKELSHAYYSGGLRFMVWVTAPDGQELPLFDGGAFDWLAKLTSNRRAVFVASGGGAQLVPLRFRRNPSEPASRGE